MTTTLNLYPCQTADAGNIKNMLTSIDIDLDEALIFGIAGGIGAGYSFCPSVPRNKTGSGVSIVGRYESAATDGRYYQQCFQRLGIDTDVFESSGIIVAEKRLCAALTQHKPTLVWCSGLKLPYLQLATPFNSCGWMRTVLVNAVEDDQFIVFDQAHIPFKVSKQDLASARNGICSHKNRLMTLAASEATHSIETALSLGLQACVDALQQPHIKMFSLQGLIEWAKLIVNAKNQRGWLKVFSPYLLYQALRDVFVGIETQGTGESLYRGLFARCLTLAEPILSLPALTDVAQQYQALAHDWTDLAESCLPTGIKSFAQIKHLIRQQQQIFVQQGGEGIAQLQAIAHQIEAVQAQIKADFPLNNAQTSALLSELQTKILKLHARETDALKYLSAAVNSMKLS